MQAPFIATHNITLYLLPLVLFLCHGGHTHVIRTTTDGDKVTSGQYHGTLHIPTWTPTVYHAKFPQSKPPTDDIANNQQFMTTDENEMGTQSNSENNKHITTEGLENIRNKDVQGDIRMKRTVGYHEDLKYWDMVTHRSQVFSSKKNFIPQKWYNNGETQKRKLRSDFMMRIFECFTNSSCKHPEASMVRSFPNLMDTGKRAIDFFFLNHT